MESSIDAYIMIEEVNSYHNIRLVLLYGCVSYFGSKVQIILNCLIACQRYLRKISTPMYLLLAIYSALALI